MNENENLRREIILDNYQNPANRETVSDSSYIGVNTNNSSCIDNIDLWVKIEEDVIKDIKFNGEACAISTASTSVMTKELVGKSIEDARVYIENFYNMIEERDYDAGLFKEAIAFDTIYKQANRKTCATLPYKGILDAIDKYLKDNQK